METHSFVPLYACSPSSSLLRHMSHTPAHTHIDTCTRTIAEQCFLKQSVVRSTSFGHLHANTAARPSRLGSVKIEHLREDCCSTLELFEIRFHLSDGAEVEPVRQTHTHTHTAHTIMRFARNTPPHHPRDRERDNRNTHCVRDGRASNTVNARARIALRVFQAHHAHEPGSHAERTQCTYLRST
jgi:hypothetical protein